MYVCVCSQEDIVCEWACTIYSTRNSIAKKLNGGHFESVFDWFALSTNTIFQGTWHMAQKGRGKDNIPLCTKFENGTHTHTHTHTLTHSHRGRFAAGNGGSGGGLWLLSDAHENQQIFFFPLCFAATQSKQELHESSSSVAAANNRATTTATTITKDENNSNTAAAASVAAGEKASAAKLAFFLASKISKSSGDYTYL